MAAGIPEKDPDRIFLKDVVWRKDSSQQATTILNFLLALLNFLLAE